MIKPRTRNRDAGTGEFVTPEYAEAHRGTTVTERNRAPLTGEEAVTFKRGDRIEHPSVGKATVTSGKLGPHGELKVRPDELHHSGLKIVEVMGRRCVKL
jgi:hypothetical protein